MKVFLSWSGDRSKYIAEALRLWLPRVIQAVKPWMSDLDIPAGARWQTDIAHELDAADFGIICVTPENMDKPWLMFEAGALSKSMKASRVCPVVYSMDVATLHGPIAQFQANTLDESGIFQVLKAINAAMAEKGLAVDHLKEQFDMLWGRFEQVLATIPPYSATTPQQPTTLAASWLKDAESVLAFLQKINFKNQGILDVLSVGHRQGAAEASVASLPDQSPSVVYAPVSTMEGALVVVTAQWDQRLNLPDHGAAFMDLISTVSADLDKWHSSGFPVPIVAFDTLNVQPISREQTDALLALGRQYRDSVEIGIAERYLMSYPEQVSSLAHELRAGGLLLAIRDFGTGGSSLAYLKELPLHALWIGDYFVQKLSTEFPEEEVTAIAGIISLAQQLNMIVVADGVSNAEESRTLTILGVKNISGSMAGDPMSSDDVYKRIAV
jgi:EAL domain-containing protein (putative c-di-GMP-specific phosphodiesterase class I)